MEEIIKRAKELGKAISRHPRFAALMASRDAVQGDAEAKKVLEQYQEQVEKMPKLADEGKPVEVEDKHELARREQVLVSNETMKQFTKAQADYSELMQKMNDAIFSEIAEKEKPQEKS